MISVVLPYRNAARTLSRALDSVLSERAVDEVVCVEDGSTDDGPAIVRARAETDARVVRVATGGAGLVAALDLGVRTSRGDLVARMDADDVSLPGRFDVQALALETDPSLAAIGTRVETEGAGEGMAAYIEWQNGLISSDEIAREIFVESPVCHPSMMIRRRALFDVGGFRMAPWIEDYDLWLRMDARGMRIAKVPEVLFRWCHAEGRVTFTDPRCSREALVLARAKFLPARIARMARGRSESITMWGAGKTGRRLARALIAEGAHVSRFIDIDPRKLGKSVYHAPICDAEILAQDSSSIVVVAVGARGARDVVRARLRAKGRTEGEDFLCAA